MARAPASVEDLNFDELSDGQLRELIHRAREHLSQRITAKLDELRTLALEAGLSVSVSPIGDGGTHRRGSKSAGQRHTAPDRRGKVAPKFRNPDNPTEIWSGRGREPLWYKNKLAAGVPEESLRIDRASSQQVEPPPAPPG
jgi:DNA-binding protein H-NS